MSSNYVFLIQDCLLILYANTLLIIIITQRKQRYKNQTLKFKVFYK